MENMLVGSLQPPNQPRWLHDAVVVDMGIVEVRLTVFVMEGAGAAVGVVDVVVVWSLQPNQPGVLQVEVDVEVVELEEVVVVVVSSRQPHQPGVLQVVVLVLVLVDEDDDEVEVSDPLLSKKFQLKQSRHSDCRSHFGTVS